jgi:diguanylate cyclase (GGDEF)-like protein
MPEVNDRVTETLVSNLSKQLAQIEKRDWELWLVVVVTGAIVALGMLALLVPTTFLRGGELHLEIDVSKELFFALIAMLVIFNLYVMSRKFDLRRTRQQLVGVTMQNELTRLQSFIDPLTEVYNRRSLDEMAGKYISRARRTKTPLTFLLADLDRFKQINTKFGHLTGDLVLAEIAALLRSCVRGSDSVVRYGGDEFLIFLADANSADSDTVVRRIEASLQAWNRSGQLPEFDVTVSIGIAEWKDGATLDETLDAADEDMYKGKAKAR